MPPAAVDHGYWPSPEHELLLRAAFLKQDEALAPWREWRCRHELRELDAGSHRLLPLVHENLKNLAPGPDLDTLKRLVRESFRNFALLTHAVQEPLRALECAGLEPLLLKGLPLAVAHYPAPHLRPMADCDILVRPRDADAALDVLEKLGWTHPGFSSFATATSCTGPRGFCIDLHQNAHAQCPYDRHDEELWTRAVPVTVAGIETRTLSATDHLYYVALHGLRWDPVPPVRWAADMMVLLRSSESIQWRQLLATARGRTLVWPLRDALEYLHRTLEAPVPESVLQELKSVPLTRVDRLERLAWSRPPQMMDGFWIKYARYQRLKRNGAREFQVSLCTFLRDAWDLERTRELPAMMMRRAQTKLGERRARA